MERARAPTAAAQPSTLAQRERVRREPLSRRADLPAHGLDHWGGPTHATEALARVMGFENVENLYRYGERIAGELRGGAELSAADPARALIVTEFVFASDYYGAGWDWENVTGFGDEDTVKRLRDV